MGATIQGDRRNHARYELDLPLDYELSVKGRVVERGWGRTVNLSSGGMLIEIASRVAEGTSIDLRVEWPVLLGGICPMHVRVRGSVVRTGEGGTAIRARRYEFRTHGARSFHADPFDFVHTLAQA